MITKLVVTAKDLNNETVTFMVTNTTGRVMQFEATGIGVSEQTSIGVISAQWGGGDSPVDECHIFGPRTSQRFTITGGVLVDGGAAPIDWTDVTVQDVSPCPGY